MNLRQIDLNLLVALDVLLTERNVTRAGEKLNLSQSAMSGILAKLRHYFDDELLVRVGRNFELTALAQELAGPVRQCLQQVEDVLNTKRPFVPQEESRVLQIAASDYAVLLLLAPLVKRLAEVAPKVSVRFVKLDSHARELLAGGAIDFCIMPRGVQTSLPSADLFDDSWVCIAWAGHPELGESMNLAEFMAQPHMGFNIGDTGHNSVADEYLAHHGYARNIVATTESLTNAPFLLQGTRMLTVVQRRLAERLRAAAGIRLIELPMTIPSLSEQLVWNPRFTQSRAHEWMRGLMCDVAARL